MHAYILLIHLLSAIIFLGFIFTDVVFLSVLPKIYGKEKASEIKENITSKRAIKVIPFVILALILSGLYLLMPYLGAMPIMLHIKLTAVGLILIGVAYALTMRLIIKKPAHPFMKSFHAYVLVLGLIAVVSAKLMLTI